MYKGGYALWTPDAYAHPAKGSPPLFFRIIEHLEELGLLTPGSVILDPMAGISTTLICGYLKGYATAGVELEPRFYALSQANIRRLMAKHPGLAPEPVLVQGDARKLPELLGGWDFWQQNGDALSENTVSILSPPYSESISGDSVEYTKERIRQGKYKGKRPDVWTSEGNKAGSTFGDGYGHTPGQIGAMKDTVAITSPPYEQSEGRTSSPFGGVNGMPEGYWDGTHGIRHKGDGYGQSEGQLANEGSYLDAMRQVYAAIAQVSNVCCLVLKNPTRNGKLRRLDLDTIRICQETGWTLHCQHQSVLFEELETADMFSGESVKQPKGRLSFFKRLSYKKGSPVADHEDVLIFTREDGGNGKAILSPPYLDSGAELGGTGDTVAGRQQIHNSKPKKQGYGHTDGQIGALPDKPKDG